MNLLIQADVDGELSPAEAARVAAHLDACPDCARRQAALLALTSRIREEIPRHRAPGPLREVVAAKAMIRPARRIVPSRGWWAGGATAALAASLAMFAVFPRANPMPDWIVAAHIRALQPDHLVDVVSSEQHTVKPWFAGRLPFAPPVKNLSAEGFPLVGARLDYLPGNTAATLVYRRRQHVINLFIWPVDGDERDASAGTREGYNFLRWKSGGMTFWAASDLNAKELGDFAALWR
jgi:anti-sigma factor RsiW